MTPFKKLKELGIEEEVINEIEVDYEQVKETLKETIETNDKKLEYYRRNFGLP